MKINKLKLSIRSNPEIMHSLYPIYNPDYAWRHLDGEGHIHAWVDGKLPSLDHVIDEEGDDDYPGVSHYECKICKEHVEPKLKEDEFRTPIVVQGPTTFILETEEGTWLISKEDYERITEILRRRILDGKLLEETVTSAIRCGYED